MTVKEEEYNSLSEKVQDLQFQVQSLKAKNESLANELISLGKKPDQKHLADSGEDKENRMEAISAAMKKLEKVISDSPAPNSQYARFLFLWSSGIGERYNSFEGKTFDELIEAGLVASDSDDFYKIVEDHPRNQRAIELMRDVEKAIDSYLEKYDQPSEHLFNWGLSDPEFWETFSGLNVSK